MEQQEREQLARFLQQLAQARAGQKDAEADSLIREACARQPDAAYLLVQRALLLEHALDDARASVTRLQAELIAAQAAQVQGGGFLADANAWGQAPATPYPAARPAPATPQSPPPAAPQAPGGAPSWGGSFLGNVAATAAGVAAGSFLFQGIEHLFAGHHGAGAGQGLAGIGDDRGNPFEATPSSLASMDDLDAGGLDDLGPGEGWS